MSEIEERDRFLLKLCSATDRYQFLDQTLAKDHPQRLAADRVLSLVIEDLEQRCKTNSTYNHVMTWLADRLEGNGLVVVGIPESKVPAIDGLANSIKLLIALALIYSIIGYSYANIQWPYGAAHWPAERLLRLSQVKEYGSLGACLFVAIVLLRSIKKQR